MVKNNIELHEKLFDYAQSDCQTEWPPNFIGHNVKMTESFINAVISTSTRGEISSNKQISPIVEMTIKLKSVIGSVVEVFILNKNIIVI